MYNILLVAVRGLEVIAGWYFIFYRLNTPEARWRRIALLAAFPALFVLWYLLPINVWFAPGTKAGQFINDDVVNEIVWVAFLLILALLQCEKGRLRSALFTALWYAGIEQNIDVLRAWINILYHGGEFVRNMTEFVVQYLVVLAWAFFYYRTARKYSGEPPLRLQILTLVVTLTNAVFLTFYSANIREAGYFPFQTQIIESGLYIGSFLLVINFIMYYFFLKLFLLDTAKTLAMEVSHTPPLWTAEGGLSTAFCEEKRITPQERKVVEALLSGKASYKEIALATSLEVKTIEKYLHNVYQKTGAYNMMALYSLIKG